MTLNIGDTVAGRYVLEQRLGAGGMGVVYRAEDTTLGRDVALKVLLPHIVNDEGLLQRFRREARVLAQLRNPGITTVHDLVITEDGSTALILEYVAGGSLDGRIEAGPLPWRTVAQIGVAAAEALAEAHGAGIVHRDIKPSNILLELDGGVRVADFGIAQVAGEAAMTMQGETVGTPAYMSPEQASGTEVGPASDIYSLGACLFAAATGRTPFVTEEGGFAAALAHITQPVPDPRAVQPGLPDAGAHVIMRAMSKDPGQRYASATEFASALRASADLSTGDIPVAPPPAIPSDGPPTWVPVAMPPPAADATQLGTPPPTPPPPAAAQYAAPPVPPVPPAAVPSGGSGKSLNLLVVIGAAIALAIVAVIVVVTLVMTGDSNPGSDDVTGIPTQSQGGVQASATAATGVTESPSVRPANPGNTGAVRWEAFNCMSSNRKFSIRWQNDSGQAKTVRITAATEEGQRFEWIDLVLEGASVETYVEGSATSSPTGLKRDLACEAPDVVNVDVMN